MKSHLSPVTTFLRISIALTFWIVVSAAQAASFTFTKIADTAPVLSQGPYYEAHCKEPLPVFTLGEHSNPTKAQEGALCACIWKNLGGWEREVSEKLSQGKGSEVSALYMRAFPPRFGVAIEKCGGMNL